MASEVRQTEIERLCIDTDTGIPVIFSNLGTADSFLLASAEYLWFFDSDKVATTFLLRRSGLIKIQDHRGKS
jgi:hypothetical protein